jgi:hypothetical protein
MACPETFILAMALETRPPKLGPRVYGVVDGIQYSVSLGVLQCRKTVEARGFFFRCDHACGETPGVWRPRLSVPLVLDGVEVDSVRGELSKIISSCGYTV